MVDKIKEAVKKATGKELGEVVVPERSEFGDYSTNAPFLWAKALKMSPLEIAKEAAEKIKEADADRLFSKVEAAPPGFINFWISKNALIKELVKILNFPSSLKLRKGKQKICLEFISANPTGPVTMANGRGGFLGDTLANVLETAGHSVTREYYINDAGNQIKTLGESILAALGKAPAKEEHYQGEYVKEIAKELARKIKPKNSPEEIGRLATTIFIKQAKKSIEKIGVKFDVWFSEFKKLRGAKGLNFLVLSLLKQKGLVVEHDGAQWLQSGDIADPLRPGPSEASEKDRVLVKSDGQPTYFLSDLAYHYDKFFRRRFDLAINIWGADHHGYVARLKSGVKALGVNPDRLQILVTQLVRLVENGQEVRMSKRTGEFITLDELIKDVGADATRFFFLMYTPDTHMDFDLNLAKEKSLKNPVYYAQYAYVRCLSILKKAKGIKGIGLENLSSENDLAVIKELIRWPEIVRQTAMDYQVSRLTRYALELARTFHNFYEKERVITEDQTLTRARLALVAAAKTIFERLFKLIGISAPKKM